MILFTQLFYTNISMTNYNYFLRFNVSMTMLGIPRVFHVQRNPWVFQIFQVRGHPAVAIGRTTMRLMPFRVLSCKKGSPYSITKCRVPEFGSQPTGDVSHKRGGRLSLLSARPAVTPTTLKRAATNFAAWWTEARWVWTVCLLRLLPDSVATAIWTRALLRLSPAR